MLKLLIITVLLNINCFHKLYTKKIKLLKNRVINRHRAYSRQFPWHAFLFIPINNRIAQICGGSIISSRFILTAAHCVYGAKTIKIGLGTITKTKHRHVTHGISTNIHPFYNDTQYENDIAIVTTHHEIKFGLYIRPVHLPTRSMEHIDFTGTIAKVCGFGRIKGIRSPARSNTLQWLPVRIIPTYKCKILFPFIKSSSICGQGFYQAVCLGDSGGGLIVNYSGINIIIGIVSFGSENFCATTPAAYEKVTSNLDFIARVTNIRISP